MGTSRMPAMMLRPLQRQQINRLIRIELVDFPLVGPVEIHPFALDHINLMTKAKIVFENISIQMSIVATDHMDFHSTLPNGAGAASGACLVVLDPPTVRKDRSELDQSSRQGFGDGGGSIDRVQLA